MPPDRPRRHCTHRSRRSRRCGSAASSRSCRASAIPSPNLSHFRSIEIWDTASRSDRSACTTAGSRARLRASDPSPPRFAADGVVIGRQRPRSACRRRHPRDRAREYRAVPAPREARRSRRASTGNAALAHILKTEGDIVQAAAHLDAQLSRSRRDVPDEPVRQRGQDRCARRRKRVRRRGRPPVARKLRHAREPGADTGAAARRPRARSSSRWRPRCARSARWDRTLVVTYAEFGVARRRTSRVAPITEPRACISRSADAWRADSTARRPSLAPRPATATSRTRSTSGSVYATVLDGWWAAIRARCWARATAPLPIPQGLRALTFSVPTRRGTRASAARRSRRSFSRTSADFLRVRAGGRARLASAGSAGRAR